MQAMNSKRPDYTVFVPSTDEYSDLWIPFLHYLDKFWSWRDANVLLGSNFINQDLPGATVHLTGASKYWGEHVLKLLDLVETDNILLMMPDFFLTNYIDASRFSYYLELFKTEQIKCLALTPRSINKHGALVYPGCKEIDLTGAYSVSLDVSLWKVDALRKVLRPSDSPWSLERSSRIEHENPKKWCYVTEAVFHYSPTGALIRGSWSRTSRRMLKHDGLQSSLGSRPVLSRRLSSIYGMRSLFFKLISVTCPDLIRAYNLRILKTNN